MAFGWILISIWLMLSISNPGTGASLITVNGARGRTLSLPSGIQVRSDVAQVVWRLLSPRRKIVTYSNRNSEYYGSEEYKQRLTFYPGNFNLEIRALRSEDAGDYEVTVTANSGEQSQNIIRLEVYDPVSGTDIMVQYSTKTCNITLICFANLNNSISFRWWRGGEVVGSDSHYHLQQHGEVNEVLYTCEARNPISNEITEVWLGDICEKNKSAPPTNVTRARGASVTLHPGILVGQSIAVVVWMQVSLGKKIVTYAKSSSKYYGSEEYKQRITFHPGNFSLEIRDLRREDSGDYEVTVTASSGAQTQRVMRLEVYDPVSGTVITAQYTAKTCDITLICSANFGSSISFRWWRGQEVVGDQSHYHLQQPGEEKEVKKVLYTCEAWNPISNERTEFWLGDICEKTIPDPSDRSTHTGWIIAAIVMFILFGLCGYILCIKRHDLRSRRDKCMGKKSSTSDGQVEARL